jgi:hypothetical protein
VRLRLQRRLGPTALSVTLEISPTVVTARSFAASAGPAAHYGAFPSCDGGAVVRGVCGACCSLDACWAVPNGHGEAVICSVCRAGDTLGEGGAVPDGHGGAVVRSVCGAGGALGDSVAVPNGHGRAVVRSVGGEGCALGDGGVVPNGERGRAPLAALAGQAARLVMSWPSPTAEVEPSLWRRLGLRLPWLR